MVDITKVFQQRFGALWVDQITVTISYSKMFSLKVIIV